MADMDGVLQIEMRGKRGLVMGVVIHIVAIGDLGQTPMTPAAGDHAIAMLQEEQHLRVPVVGQRPAMAEHNRLTGTPVLVVDLNAVFGFNGGMCPF